MRSQCHGFVDQTWSPKTNGCCTTSCPKWNGKILGSMGPRHSLVFTRCISIRLVVLIMAHISNLQLSCYFSLEHHSYCPTWPKSRPVLAVFKPPLAARHELQVLCGFKSEPTKNASAWPLPSVPTHAQSRAHGNLQRCRNIRTLRLARRAG